MVILRLQAERKHNTSLIRACVYSFDALTPFLREFLCISVIAFIAVVLNPSDILVEMWPYTGHWLIYIYIHSAYTSTYKKKWWRSFQRISSLSDYTCNKLIQLRGEKVSLSVSVLKTLLVCHRICFVLITDRIILPSVST